MSQERLDLSAFTKAIESLNVALQAYENEQGNEFIRDASIQRFEYSYELATKMLKRYLSLTLANPSELTEMTFQNLIRTAYGKGLIPNSWDQWSLFRHARNITSHTYSEEKAIEVLEVLPLFYKEVAFLLDSLERANETQF